MAARVGVAASGDLESGSTSTNTSAASNASSSPSNLASSADNAPNVPMDRDSKAELYVTDQTRSQSIFLFFFIFFFFSLRPVLFPFSVRLKGGNGSKGCFHLMFY
jgi:hypothetical protein